VDSVVETIQYVHSEVAGHRGLKATVDKLLRAGYNRSNLQQEVEYVIANCGFCQKIANRRQDDDKSQPRFNEIMEVGEEWSLDTIASQLTIRYPTLTFATSRSRPLGLENTAVGYDPNVEALVQASAR
jgi:hypothetical protein